MSYVGGKMGFKLINRGKIYEMKMLPVHDLIRNLHEFIDSPDVIGAKLVNFSTL